MSRDYVGRSRRGFPLSSGLRPGGRYGWACGCGANGEDYADGQDAALAARSHAMRCGHPDRRICH
ncbi:hypothetical protein FHS39_002565 [Streptomyces olivoverticillatus]|uniref:Uncharacterized protein n=1 Tax=Streptomyces olivoverticillatus TaxID=66427 RepID=A0A7W7LNT1_9ACTN|nr:hypothetical protein [Streptomyces olivoverticillatus]